MRSAVARGDSGAPAAEIPGLTGARGLAASGVVVVHVLAMTSPATVTALHLAPLASAAVTFFFALSGFLLGAPFIRAIAGRGRPPAFGRYARQRLLRIFPGYVVIFLIADLVLRAVYVTNAEWVQKPRSDVGSGRITDPLRLLEQLTLTHDFVPSQMQTGLNPSWSLTTELSFYLLLPLLGLVGLAMVRRGAGRLRAAAYLPAIMIGLGLVAKALDAFGQWRSGLTPTMAQFGPNGVAVFSRSVLVAADAFGWGLAAAVLYVWQPWTFARRWPAARIRRLALAVFLAGAVVGGLLAPTRTLLGEAVFALAGAGLVLAAAVPTPSGAAGTVGRLLDLAPFHFLGRVSLSLYLWHYPVLLVAIREGWIGPPTHLGGLWSLSLVFAIATAASWLTYHLVEAPAMRLGRRTRPGVVPPPVAPAPVGVHP